MSVICVLLTAYFLVLVARIIFSWIPMQSEGLAASVRNLVYALTEPILGPIRRVIPPIGMGGMGLDLSPILVFLGLSLIMSAVGCAAIF